jgi:hypothetical protein
MKKVKPKTIIQHIKEEVKNLDFKKFYNKEVKKLKQLLKK